MPTPESENVTLVDLPALRRALDTIEAHRELLVASLRDLGFTQYARIDLSHAIRHVLDGYRSPETRASS